MYMKLKLLILIGSITGLGILIACTQRQDDNRAAFFKEVITATQENHIESLPIDDQLSKKLFTHYLTQLDPNKVFFSQTDIDELQSFQLSIDDELKSGQFTFFEQSIQLLRQAVLKAEKYYKENIAGSFNLSLNESFETNASKIDYAKSDAALSLRWKKKLTKMLFDELLIVEQQDPALNKKLQMEKALIKVRQRADKIFTRYKNISEEDLWNRYINSYLKIHDFQSTYLSPSEKAAWDASYTRSYVGIGARLVIVNDYPEIKELVIGGPAWKSKQLVEGDVILEVTPNPNEEAVSTMGLKLSDVIELLVGDRLSEVSMLVRRQSGEIKSISIIRDQIAHDLAMSFVLHDEVQKRKIGLLRLPRFYTGNEGSAYHVLNEIERLKAKNIDGLIFDVRNNQGGSSGEAIDIIGLFLEQGVVMQTQSRALSDVDGIAQYDGELLVLTNTRSGSASELFSGTLQDYNRACIVGSTSTFGKGSMQRFFNMDNEQGAIKLTVGRFFTASGRSPQRVGIIPDITLPDDDLYVPSGERIHDNSLPPKDLPITTVSQSVHPLPDLTLIKKQSENRVAKNAPLQLAKEKAKQIKAEYDHTKVYLNYEDYKKNTLITDEKYQSIYSKINGFTVEPTATLQDSIALLRQEIWVKKILQDPYVYECYQVMNDLLAS